MMVSTNKPSNQLVTPRNRVFLNKPTDPQPGKKFLKNLSYIILQSTRRYNQLFPYFSLSQPGTYFYFTLFMLHATPIIHQLSDHRNFKAEIHRSVIICIRY
jgi:hypothetical protein